MGNNFESKVQAGIQDVKKYPEMIEPYQEPTDNYFSRNNQQDSL
jgi:hypothetical protein